MAYVKKADRVQTPNELDDAALGIGIADDPASAQDGGDLAALLANPAVAALIDAAVAKRLVQMGSDQPAPKANGVLDGDAIDRLANTIGRMMELNSMQQAGYIKPLPAHEVESRLNGKIEMDALLARYESLGTPPLWTVGEGGFFECVNAAEFVAGQKVRMYIPPPEDFIPENEEARNVHAALMKWLGVRTPHIADQVKMAHLAAKQAPLVTGAMTPARAPGLVEMVADAPVEPQRLRRSMGTITPERHNVAMADRDGAPVGPAFVDTAQAA